MRDDVRALYAEQARNYDQRWRRYTDRSLARLMAGLHPRGDECVLNVPVGTGELALRLQKCWPGLRIHDVDLAPEMLAVAGGKLGGRVRLVAPRDWFAVPRIQTLDSCRRLLDDAGFAVAAAERFRAGWAWGMMAVYATTRPITAPARPGPPDFAEVGGGRL